MTTFTHFIAEVKAGSEKYFHLAIKRDGEIISESSHISRDSAGRYYSTYVRDRRDLE